MRIDALLQKFRKNVFVESLVRLHVLKHEDSLTLTISWKSQTVAIIDWLIIIVPSVVFVFHALLFRTWIIDDAGISFSYSRSLSQGFGLVSQPGNPPVEGYSNALWVFLLSPFFSLGIFNPTITPKLVSTLMVVISFVLIGRTLAQFSDTNRLITFGILTLIAINTSFVVWTTSGLENPLYVLLICLLLYWSVRSILLGKMSNLNGVIVGLIAGGIALTRPEGIIFFGVYPLILIFKAIYTRSMLHRSDVLNLLAYVISFVLLFGSYIIFRLLYFDDFFPNTYYAKVGPGLSFRQLLSIITLESREVTRVLELVASVAGRFGTAALIGLIAMTVYLIPTKRFKLEHFVLSIFLVWTILAYLLLPNDWMKEWRFATPFFVFFYVYTGMLVNAFIKSLNLGSSHRIILGTFVMVAFVGGSLLIFNGRSTSFADRPTVPFAHVANKYGYRFNDYANQLGLQRASILLPDVGGTLYYSNLRVYDMAGLTDRTIAKTYYQQRNLQAFYDYVFETAKPTFIHTHGTWTRRYKFDDDKRFRRDYVPIDESIDSWIQNNYGEAIYSGDYVRKDVIEGNIEALDRIR